MRTYQPLEENIYFKPLGVYLKYYSKYFDETYFDGYGWNFYTNEGGYYDGKYKIIKSAGTVMLILVSIIIICFCTCVIYTFCRKQIETEHEYEEEHVMDIKDVDEVELAEEDIKEKLFAALEYKIKNATPKHRQSDERGNLAL